MFSIKHCFEKTIKVMGHHSRLKDVMGQSYAILPVLVLISRVIHRSKLHFAIMSSKDSLQK